VGGVRRFHDDGGLGPAGGMDLTIRPALPRLPDAVGFALLAYGSTF
jgi:hypothetical protein